VASQGRTLEVLLLLELLQQPTLRAEAAQTLTRAISHGVVSQDQARPPLLQISRRT
jgi:hypothetical protein